MVNQFGSSGGWNGGGVPGLSQYSVVLNGIAAVIAVTATKGNYTIKIASQVTDGPSAHVNFVKTDPTVDAIPHGVDSTASPDGNVIQVSWGPGGNIHVAKSMASYDGTYLITVVG